MILGSTKGNLPHVRTELDKYLNEKGPELIIYPYLQFINLKIIFMEI